MTGARTVIVSCGEGCFGAAAAARLGHGGGAGSDLTDGLAKTGHVLRDAGKAGSRCSLRDLHRGVVRCGGGLLCPVQTGRHHFQIAVDGVDVCVKATPWPNTAARRRAAPVMAPAKGVIDSHECMLQW
jgi:hypothetical protein